MNDLDAGNKKIKFITCEVVYDEIKERIPGQWETLKLEKRLHERSYHLKETLQKEIDEAQDFDIIILGYGLCGKSVDGLISKNTYLVIPKCDDCISLFLGSAEEYRKQIKKEPGTYYLTKGYIGENENPMLANYSEYKEKYDEETLEWLIKEMLKNYKRLVYVNTGNYPPEQWRKIAKEQADKLDLQFEEIAGSDGFFKDLIEKNWGKEFLIFKPGEKVKYEKFLTESFNN
jgi:hypothetical protein